jgi:hypothetical protein
LVDAARAGMPKTTGRFQRFVIASLLLVGSSCAQEDDVDSTRPELTYAEFLELVYQEPDTGVYLANGDELFETEAEIRALYDDLFRDGELIVNTVGGEDDRWYDPEQHNLTYCVSTNFGARYADAVNAMSSATGAWEGAADVDFVHESALDSNCNNRSNVVFNVRMVNSGCQYLARAFFPSTGRRNREILVDQCAFNYGNDPSVTGVLRHELGHTIGFRHEHTRPEAGVCFEDNNWRALTPYDQASVMHYPQCNGTGQWDLNLTNYDRQGAADLYATSGGGGTCFPDGDSCSADSDCCSNNCGGPPHRRTCR